MRRLLGLISGLGLGLTFSQAPEFTQQYEQRLGGAVDELRVIVTDFEAAAAKEGLDLETALVRFDANTDTFIAGRGADMRSTIVRYNRLSGHIAELENATSFDRVISLVKNYDPQIAARAAEAFQPAVPVTVEGGMFAGAGLLGGYGLVSLFSWPFRRRNRIRIG